jgi:hypothetical protein
METSVQIKDVRVITKAGSEGVIFVTNKGDIFRTPQQALYDMQNSGRVIGNVAPLGTLAQQAYRRCATFKAVATGDITFVKAGDTYEVRPDSAVIVDRTHPEYGKWKVGEQRPATKDFIRVEGFLSVPETMQETQMQFNAQATAQLFMEMQSAIGLTAPATIDVPAEPVTEPVVDEVESALMGTKPAKPAK